MARKSGENPAARVRAVVGVIGHSPLLERDDGAVAVLRQLGAEVRAQDLWDDPQGLIEDGSVLRALVFEALDRPDLGVAALRALRKEKTFDAVGTLLVVTVSQLGRVEPSNGFDDFVLHPYVPAELYARIRALEWKVSEFASEERHKVGAIVVDRAAHEVSSDGKPVALTAKEFALLVYFCERRGRALSREHLPTYGAIATRAARVPSTSTYAGCVRN